MRETFEQLEGQSQFQPMNKEKFGVFLHATSKFLRHWCAGKGSEMVQVHYCTFQSRCCAMVRKGGLAVFRCFIARERKISRRYFSKYINIIIDIFITNKLLLFYYVKYYIFKKYQEDYCTSTVKVCWWKVQY